MSNIATFIYNHLYQASAFGTVQNYFCHTMFLWYKILCVVFLESSHQVSLSSDGLMEEQNLALVHRLTSNSLSARPSSLIECL